MCERFYWAHLLAAPFYYSLRFAFVFFMSASRPNRVEGGNEGNRKRMRKGEAGGKTLRQRNRKAEKKGKEINKQTNNGRKYVFTSKEKQRREKQTTSELKIRNDISAMSLESLDTEPRRIPKKRR